MDIAVREHFGFKIGLWKWLEGCSAFLLLPDLLNIIFRTMKTHDMVSTPLEGFADFEASSPAASSGTGRGSIFSPEPKTTCS